MGQSRSKVLQRKVAPIIPYVRCLRIPADGSRPHIVTLPTVNNVDGNHDSFLFHLPNFRQFWNSEERWRFRTYGTMNIEDHPLRVINGLYYMFKSFAPDDDVPPNKHLRGSSKGDAFIVKLNRNPDGFSRASYDNVSAMLITSTVLPTMLRAMSKPVEAFWIVNYDRDVPYVIECREKLSQTISKFSFEKACRYPVEIASETNLQWRIN